MRCPCQLGSKVLLVLFALVVVVLLFQPADAAPLCTDLPPSSLRIYDIKAPVEAAEVPAEELDRSGPAGDLTSRHTLMLTLSDIVSMFEIAHRVLPRADGSFCDSPSVVRIGFGSGRRLAFLARPAAEDACVRHEMLAHEAAHTSAFNEVVDRFIEHQQGSFQRGMTALKQTPAPTPEVAKARWEMGLRAIVAEARQQLLAEIRSANASIDQPSNLVALEDACGGKIRQLEQSNG